MHRGDSKHMEIILGARRFDFGIANFGPKESAFDRGNLSGTSCCFVVQRRLVGF